MAHMVFIREHPPGGCSSEALNLPLLPLWIFRLRQFGFLWIVSDGFINASCKMIETFWFLRFWFRRFLCDATSIFDFYKVRSALTTRTRFRQQQPAFTTCLSAETEFLSCFSRQCRRKVPVLVGAYNFPWRNNHTKIFRGDYRFNVHRKWINIARRWNVTPLFFISHWQLTRKPLIVRWQAKFNAVVHQSSITRGSYWSANGCLFWDAWRLVTFVVSRECSW